MIVLGAVVNLTFIFQQFGQTLESIVIRVAVYDKFSLDESK